MGINVRYFLNIWINRVYNKRVLRVRFPYVTFAPHPPQKLFPGITAAPQLGQNLFPDAIGGGGAVLVCGAYPWAGAAVILFAFIWLIQSPAPPMPLNVYFCPPAMILMVDKKPLSTDVIEAS